MANNKRFFKLSITILLMVLFSFVFGALIGYLIRPPSLASSEPKNNNFSYISKETQRGNPNQIIISFRGLRENLNKYIEEENKKINLYFEYIPTGSSIGINEEEVMFGGSLSKVAFVMQTYKLIDEGKIKAEDSVTIKQEYLDDRWGNLFYGGAGRQIKIKDLAYETIVNSDNTALNTLTYEVNKKYPEDLFRELGIIHPEISEFDISIETSPKEYVKILKSLYFSSYLSFKSSNEILELMTKIKDGEGLRGNIPKNIKIAHKVGFNIDTEEPDISMISDCGIIYIPKKPYILCIMIQDDKESAQEDMKVISNMVYSYIQQK